MFDENGMLKKKEFVITIRDAKRIIDSLEFSADFDKTEIYYELKQWVDQENSQCWKLWMGVQNETTR